MNDVLKEPIPESSSKKESELWLKDLKRRIDLVQNFSDKDILTTGIVISRIGGDAVNSGFPFITRADIDSGITPEFYQKAINGFKVTWLEVEGAISEYKGSLPEHVKDYFENNIIKKYRPTFDKISDPNFDPNELNSLYQNEGKDFLMETHATQKIFGEEITKAMESPRFERKFLF